MSSLAEIDENSIIEDSKQVERTGNKMKLTELKVSDLKAELEKRDLDKTGVKSVLLERLKNAIVEEGKDPEEILFEIVSDSSNFKSPVKKKKNTLLESNGEIINKNISEVNKEDCDSINTNMSDSNKEDCDSTNTNKSESNKEAGKINTNISESNKEDDKIITNISESIKEGGDINTNISESKKEDDIEENSKEEIIDNIDDEVIDTSNDIDDKCNSNEEMLQLSIDEEDARLNDDENILEISQPIEIETKPIEEEQCIAIEEEQCIAIEESSSTIEKSPSIKITQAKPVKSTNEEVKEKNKTSQVVKSAESSALSPKALKVLGKNDKIKTINTLAKSLCITGLPNTTRASDLTTLFSKQGRVLSVKIVKSTKQTPIKCYGLVTMASRKDAAKAIQNLHRTEFSSRIISVERTQNEPAVLLKKSESKSITPSAKKQVVKKEVSSMKVPENLKTNSLSERKVSKQSLKALEAKLAETPEKPKEKIVITEKSKPKDKERKSREHKERLPIKKFPTRYQRQYSFKERPRFIPPRRNFTFRPYFSKSSFQPTSMRYSRSSSTAYSLQKIREERLKLRAEREIERKRLEEITRHRYIERKQREEAYRLEREKEKLRLEREMLERERVEILKFEREKQKLERDRLEREKEELRRQTELRRGFKRPLSHIDRESEPFWDSRKKQGSRYVARSSFPSESSSSSRYELTSKVKPVLPKHEYERRTERYSNPKSMSQPSRSDYSNRESRREVTLHSGAERQVYDRNVFRSDRDARPSFQDKERHSSLKKEAQRIDWKHNRRVHERVSSNSSNISRRMYY